MNPQTRKRTILVSIPKAGTYLAARILQQMGLTDSHLHIRYDDKAVGIYDFRGAPVKMSMDEQEQRFKPQPLHESLSMVQNGEFILGHLPPVPEVKDQLYMNFRIVFLVRDLRDCLISHMRYMINIGAIMPEEHSWSTVPDLRERFRQYLLHYADEVGPLVNLKLIASWEYDLRDPYPGMEILKLHFEDLVSPDKTTVGTAIHSLARFLELKAHADVDTMIQSALGADTLTNSGAQTVREQYWSPFAEEWYTARICDAQGNNVNEMIGYG